MPNRIEYFQQPVNVKSAMPFPSMVVPFSSGSTATSTVCYPNRNGNSKVALCSFGTNGQFAFGYDLNKNGNVGLSSSNAYDFTVTTDITIVDIYAEMFNTTAVSNTNGVSPYVALAVCEGSGDAFTIIPETMTIIDTRTSFALNTIYHNSNTAVPVDIPAGTRVAIVCGHTNGSASTSTTFSIYFSGGVALW